MDTRCDNPSGRSKLRCCDAVVVGMGLVVTLAALFRPEITFLLLGE